MPAPAQTPRVPVRKAPVLAASTNDSGRAELCGGIHTSGGRGVCDVAHHGVRVAAFGVELRIGIVFRDAP
jgi:hypothetical protein